MRLPTRRDAVALVLVTSTLMLPGCAGEPAAPHVDVDDFAAGAGAAVLDRAPRPAEECENVAGTASGALGIWFAGGFGGFGLTPTPITLGEFSGTMASYVDAEYISGSKAQGAHHIILNHVFWSDDGVSWFRTSDQASCAPADNNGATCQVNDALTIVEGSGVFANATGQLHNHGWIAFTSVDPPAGTLDLRVRGRVCGSGVG